MLPVAGFGGDRARVWASRSRGGRQLIKGYSPYQRVRSGTAYPAVLVTSGDLDTRVPPLAARKFTARLQASSTSGRPVILRYHPKAGHAANYGMPFSRHVQNAAAELAFMMRELGLPMQVASATQ